MTQELATTGLRKAAIFLRALGENTTAEIMRHMPTNDIAEVSLEMTRLGHISHMEVYSALADYFSESGQYTSLGSDGNDYLRSVLVKAVGEERAASILEDILEQSPNGKGLDALNGLEPKAVAEMLRDEYPQIITTVLVHLEKRQAALVLEHFDAKVRQDLVLRMARFGGVQPGALQELTESLGMMIDGQSMKRSKMGGVKTAAEVLNLTNSQMEEAILKGIQKIDPELAQQIVDQMFLFENILDLSDNAIETLLDRVDTSSLAIALKGANEALIDKFVSNMPTRSGNMLLSEIESLGPTLKTAVESEQKSVLQTLKQLADAGEIVLSVAEDAYV